MRRRAGKSLAIGPRHHVDCTAVNSVEQLDVRLLERLVQGAFGERTSVVDVRQVRPWSVARCHLDGPDGPRTVIAKWLRSNPEGFRVDRRQIVTEAAALRLVGELAPRLAPALLAHDPAHDLLITEDLAPRRTLHSMLSPGLSPTGITGLHEFAGAIARLHVATAAAATPGPWAAEARIPVDRRSASAVLERLAELTEPTDAVRRDVDRAVAAIDAPGPFDVFSNGDSGANNVLVAADGADGRLIDFEHAGRRHGLLDVAALYVPGSMWMTIADPVPLGLEETYRTAAGEAMPAMLDDASFRSGLASACALRTLEKLRRFDKLDVRPPGHHSRPQLVATVERTIATLTHCDELLALRDWFEAVGLGVRARWPDADVTFPDDFTLRQPFDPDH